MTNNSSAKVSIPANEIFMQSCLRKKEAVSCFTAKLGANRSNGTESGELLAVTPISSIRMFTFVPLNPAT